MRKEIFTLVLTFILTTTGFAQTEDSMKTFDPAFAHTVYFWFKDPDSKADKARFETSLKTFLKNSKFAKTNFIGTPPMATRDVVDGSFTYSLIVTFESAEAQEAYQTEQAHLTFIEECKDLWEKVIVYDSFGLKQ
ncbi:Dabb family protein [Flagellimonas sp. 2504JD1-5]